MKSQVLLGIDAGTSMTKVVAFDLQGNELAVSSMKTPTSTPHESWIEEDMGEVWSSVKQCIRDVASKVDGEVTTIGITATGDGTWMIDGQGNPIRPGIMWCDGRAHEIVAKWHEDGTARQSFDMCGTAPFTGTQAAQIRWLETHEPEALEKARWIFHEKDWIFYKLTGEIRTDDSDECLTHIDMRTRRYSSALLELFGVDAYRDKLPPIVDTRNNFAALTADLGLPDGVMVAAGPMDGQAHALGVGAIEKGQGSSVLGTAGLHQVVLDDPYLGGDMVGMTLTHVLPDRWLRLNASMIATPNLDWILKVLGEQDRSGFSYTALDSEIARIPIGANGIVYHPYIFPGGERAPFVDTAAKGSFFGLNQHHTKYDLIRAVYEGVGLSMKDCYLHMPIDVSEIRLSGGGANSPFWSQLVCDMVGTPIAIPKGSEYGAKGAAINAAVATGIFSSYQEAVDSMIAIDREYAPTASVKQQFDDLYGLFLEIRKSAAPLWEMRQKYLRAYSADA